MVEYKLEDISDIANQEFLAAFRFDVIATDNLGNDIEYFHNFVSCVRCSKNFLSLGFIVKAEANSIEHVLNIVNSASTITVSNHNEQGNLVSSITYKNVEVTDWRYMLLSESNDLLNLAVEFYGTEVFNKI